MKKMRRELFLTKKEESSYHTVKQMNCFVELNTGLVNSHKGTWKHKEFFRDVILKEYLWERKKNASEIKLEEKINTYNCNNRPASWS